MFIMYCINCKYLDNDKNILNLLCVTINKKSYILLLLVFDENKNKF